ncbi:MAG: hypothetical protein ABSG94_04660, partial [Brevinematales bacterium]
MLLLNELAKPKYHGESIIKIASSMYYVHEKSPVIDLANDLDKMKHIHSVGVVNDKMKVLGILVRRELFDLLGKPYGQDILKHKTVGSLMRPTTYFN